MEQSPSSTQVNCQWCSKPMESTATRCGSCGKLRKDIYTDKVKCYVFSLLGGFLLGVSIVLLGRNRRNYEFLNNSSSNTLAYIILVAGIIAVIAAIYYYIKVSQRLKSYWWV